MPDQFPVNVGGKKDGALAVSAGLLLRENGDVFVQQRTAPPELAGLWEFPGGKIELGESPIDALVRELGEEIGIEATDVVPWMRLRHRYPKRVVHLDVLHVRCWEGEPRPQEGQSIAWVAPVELKGWPLLGANPVIVQSLLRFSELGVETPR